MSQTGDSGLKLLRGKLITEWPPAVRNLTSAVPINPDDPVTRIFILIFYSRKFFSLGLEAPNIPDQSFLAKI